MDEKSKPLKLSPDELTKLRPQQAGPTKLTAEELAKLQPSSIPDVSKLTNLTQSDLARPEIYDNIILPHMKDLYGSGDFLGVGEDAESLYHDREKGVDLFLNKMRGLSSGNLYRAGREMEFITKADEEVMQRAGAAYTLFENMQNVFSGDDISGRERTEAILDYTRSVVLDPTNLLAFVGGKVWAGAGTKSATRLAQKAAMKAYQKEIKNQLTKGATRKVAEEAAKKKGTEVFSRIGAEASKKMAQQEAARTSALNATKSTLEKATTNTAMKDIIGSTTIGTLSAFTADALQQKAYMDTGVQDSYNVYQGGLVALGGLVAGGISAGSQMLGPTKAAAKANLKTAAPKDMKRVLTQVLKETGEKGDWLQKVAKGKELTDLDTDFFATIMFGNKELGLKGLTQSMLEEGFVYAKRGESDNFSNYVTDIIKQFDPQDARSFLDEFQEVTGVKLPEVASEMEVLEQFSNTFARKISDSARLMGSMGNAARANAKAVKNISLDDLAREAAGLPSKPEPGAFTRGLERVSKITGADTFSEFLDKRFGIGADGVRNFQNNVVRGIVAHLGTMQLNLKGWGTMTAFNSVDDLMLSGLYGSVGFFQKIFGGKSSAKNLEMAGHIWKNQKFKFQNIMNPQVSVDAVSDYVSKRAEFVEELNSVVRGNVDAGEILRKNGFDPNKTGAGQLLDDYTDMSLGLSLAKGTDVMTNSVEFYTQMDRKLRTTYGKGWEEFMQLENLGKIMSTPEYRKLEASALYETRRSVMSQTMKDRTTLGEIAGFIEDFRNIPGIGVLMPFGRFFNNTVATAVEFTPVANMVAKSAGKFQHKTWESLFARNFSSLGMFYGMYQLGKESEDQQLGLFEASVSGESKDFRYEYPMGLFIGIGRLAAMKEKYGEISEEASEQFVSVASGQMTREIATSLEGVQDLALELSKGNTEGFSLIVEGFGNIGSTVASGLTRTFEPYNVVAGLLQGSESTFADKKQGNEALNESVRYIDQFVQLASGKPLEEQAFSATQGKRVPSISKFVGLRAGKTLTPFQRMLNAVGSEEWRELSNYSQMPEADNRYNKLFNELLDAKADKVMQGDLWKEDKQDENLLERRQLVVDELVKSTRDAVYRVMETDLLESGDARLLKMFKMSKSKSMDRIDKAVKDLYPDEEIEFKDLTEEQVDAIGLYFKHRETYLKGGKP